MEIFINYWAVLAAAVAGFAVGALWYSPVLFGKRWQALMGYNEESMRSMRLSAKQAMALGFVTTLITAYVLAHFIALLGLGTLAGALQLGFWAWLGFIAMTQMGSVLWENRPPSLFLINASQTLVATLVMAAILGLWQ